MPVSILDLYCGMGGLSLGFALAVREAQITGYDIDRHAVETYNLNLNKHGCRAYVCDLLKKELDGAWELVMGGVPCQPFSTANVSKVGKSHPLYPTFPRFFDLILRLKPKAFLMENVKGLLSKRHKRLFEEQISRVSGLYEVCYKVLNAVDYGVPQRRERLFMIGLRKDLKVKPSFPKPTHSSEELLTLDGKLSRWVIVREAIGDLLEVSPLRPQKPHPSRFRRINEWDAPSWTVRTNADREMIVPLPSKVMVFTHKRKLTEAVMRKTWRPFFGPDEPSFTVTKVGISEVAPWNFSEKSLKKHKPMTVSEPARTVRSTFHKTPPDSLLEVKPLDANTLNRILKSGMGLRIHKLDEPAKTVKTITGGPQNTEAYLEAPYYRRLTVRECLRLQSFPDWWSFPEKVSKTRRYKLVGEAVPPILAYKLATHLARLLGWSLRGLPKKDEWDLPYFSRAFAEYLNA